MTGQSVNGRKPNSRLAGRTYENRGLSDTTEPRLTVVIPTFNEALHIDDALRRFARGGEVEVIVVDGGSSDSTRALAESHGIKVLLSDRGRAKQMNTGAREARGEILLFLHADTLLPGNFLHLIAETLKQPTVVAGAFSVRYDAYTPLLHIIQWLANLRSRLLQLPYGDQALFLSKSVFEDLDGFPDLPVMEDLALVRRLRSRGRIATLSASVVTSSRSWMTFGVWRVAFFHVTGLIAYWLGVSPTRIHSWFRRGGYMQSEGRRTSTFP